MMIVVSLTCVFVAGAEAEELYALGGITASTAPAGTSYAWQLEYRQLFHNRMAWNFSYLNEGHVPGHHRDGPLTQLWFLTGAMKGRISLGAGAGPYFYFDTVRTQAGGCPYTDDHGWGAVVSLSASWRVLGPWLMQLRGNWVAVGSGPDSFSMLAGLGYALDAPRGGKTPAPGRNEVVLFAGQTFASSFSREGSFSAALEYRRSLPSHFEWTISWLDEGHNNALGDRSGLVSQLWLSQSYLAGRLSLGIGLGPYLFIEKSGTPDDDRVAAVAGMTVAYRPGSCWVLRFTWNRVVAGDHGDSDVFIAGAGYRF